MRHQRIFKIDGTDPFAARLDQIFRPIREPHVTLAIDRRDISGAEPAIGSPFVALGVRLKVTGSDPWTSNFQLAHRLTVFRTDAVRINRTDVDERRRQS